MAAEHPDLTDAQVRIVAERDQLAIRANSVTTR